MNLYSLAVNTPFNDSILSYFSEAEFLPGELLKVPLGTRKVSGIILKEEHHLDIPKEKIKTITEDMRLGFTLDHKTLDFYRWVAQYYYYPLGQLISDVIPKILQRPKPIKCFQGRAEDFSFKLNSFQVDIYKGISHKLNEFGQHLIHGVTGSGKTAIFTQLMKNILAQGKPVLYMLPEINLTPQFTQTLSQYLDVPIYCYFSSLTPSDRFGLWKICQEEGSPYVVLGVRSSIFLPFKSLGGIIVDEEHDSSFKQDTRCPYHARDMAIKRAQDFNIPIILGSATPSLETLVRTQERGTYYKLTERIVSSGLPKIELLDIRSHQRSSNPYWPLTSESVEEMARRLKANEQILVQLNRLGYAQMIQCHQCGFLFECKNCSLPLKLFKRKKKMSCNECDYTLPLPEQCPSCGNLKILERGYGTEKVEEVLQATFPDYTISRFDREEITNQKKLVEVLEQFNRGKIHILVGTQMLSKGHNFKNVNYVAILGTDQLLNFPDFRSEERVYQLCTQVAGRAGRYGSGAKVHLHTLSPEHLIYQFIQNSKQDEFYHHELIMRQRFQYPPFSKLMMLLLFSKDLFKLESFCFQLGLWLENLVKKEKFDIEILGPKPSMVEKRQNKYCWLFLLKSRKIGDLRAMGQVVSRYHYPPFIEAKIDVDPQMIP